MMSRKARPHQRHSLLTYLLYAFITLLIILVWTLWIAPKFKQIPNHFSYSADILSLDNFYDEKSKKFEGEHISKTVFSYEVIAKKPSYLIIKNSFQVSKLSDKPIFSVTRYYYINPYTGQHVQVEGSEKRIGYLFAPHYLFKQPFYYWHVNYDAPALMKFVDKKTIDGLTVNHYQAQYEADQTVNLTHLPGVPKKRGIKAYINLQLWIEPISGWLVKYQDNSIAYYYDKKTGQLLSPWNQFSNRYTETSVHNKVEQARALKWKYLLIDYGVPLLIILLSLLVFFNSILLRLYRLFLLHRQPIYIVIMIVLVVGASIETSYVFWWHKKQPTEFKIGISQWNDNVELLSAIRGFKDGLAAYGFYQGKNIQFYIDNPHSSIENQMNIIQTFVHDKMDIIFTLTTPGTLVAKGMTTTIPILFTDVSYPYASEIINPYKASKTNLVGTLNYISPAEQFYQFDLAYPLTKTLGFVHHKGDPDSEIQYQEYKSMLSKRNIQVIDIAAIDFEDMQNQLQQQLQRHHYDALFVACDTLIRDGGYKVAAEFSKKYKIPSFSCDQASVIHGVMIGYFADLYAAGKLAGYKAAMILQGAEPNWLKTETAGEDDLIINMLTAQLLGITISREHLVKPYTLIEH